MESEGKLFSFNGCLGVRIVAVVTDPRSESGSASMTHVFQCKGVNADRQDRPNDVNIVANIGTRRAFGNRVTARITIQSFASLPPVRHVLCCGRCMTAAAEVTAPPRCHRPCPAAGGTTVAATGNGSFTLPVRRPGLTGRHTIRAAAQASMPHCDIKPSIVSRTGQTFYDFVLDFNPDLEQTLWRALQPGTSGTAPGASRYCALVSDIRTGPLHS